MTEIGTIAGFLIAGVIGLLVGYLAGSRRVGGAQPTQAQAPGTPQFNEPPPPRQRVEAYSVDGPRSARPGAIHAPAPHRAPAPPPRQAAPQPAFQIDQRADEDRTVFRKLRSAREAFQESKEHLADPPKEPGPGDDSARFGGRKK